MAVDRLSVALDANLGADIREAAAARSMSVSAWLASAAQDKLRNQRLREFLDEWEAEDGPVTDEERAQAQREDAEALAEARREMAEVRAAAGHE